MTSKSNDFHSLLSVFRDATTPSTCSNRASFGAPHTSKTASASVKDKNVPTESDVRKSQSTAGSECQKSERIDPTSKTDPSYSASEMKERVERLLRIHQIRKSTGVTQSITEASSMDRSKSTTERNAVKIAICATIVQDFPHERLWRNWMDETGGNVDVAFNNNCTSGENKPTPHVKSDSVTDGKPSSDQLTGVINSSGEEAPFRVNTVAEMYIHAKNPEGIRSDWLRSKLLQISHRPDWNDIRIVRAMLSLIQEALRDEGTTHILFITESCIPVVTLKEAACSILFDQPFYWEPHFDSNSKMTLVSNCISWDRSYVDCYDRNSRRCSRFDEHNCWGHLRDVIPDEAVYKALPGWCLLSRKHAQHILDLPSQLGNMNLWPAFERVWAPEEVYFPTAINLCGNMDEVIRRSLTHSQWDGKAVNLKDRAHPICYDECFDDELVRCVRRGGCLFLRKMKRSLDLDVWLDIVVHRQKGRSSVKSRDKNHGTKRGREWVDERGDSWDRGDGRREDKSSSRGERHRSNPPRGEFNDRRRDDSNRRHRGDDMSWIRRR